MRLFEGNILHEIARKALKRKHKERSSYHVVQLASSDSRTLQKFGIPSKYWPDLKKLPRIMERRNGIAHVSKYGLAKTLANPGTPSHFRAYWAEAIAFTYGQTIEELVEEVGLYTVEEVGFLY
jgi:hypothetical protein